MFWNQTIILNRVIISEHATSTYFSARVCVATATTDWCSESGGGGGLLFRSLGYSLFHSPSIYLSRRFTSIDKNPDRWWCISIPDVTRKRTKYYTFCKHALHRSSNFRRRQYYKFHSSWQPTTVKYIARHRQWGIYKANFFFGKGCKGLNVKFTNMYSIYLLRLPWIFH